MTASRISINVSLSSTGTTPTAWFRLNTLILESSTSSSEKKCLNHVRTVRHHDLDSLIRFRHQQRGQHSFFLKEIREYTIKHFSLMPAMQREFTELECWQISRSFDIGTLCHESLQNSGRNQYMVFRRRRYLGQQINCRFIFS